MGKSIRSPPSYLNLPWFTPRKIETINSKSDSNSSKSKYKWSYADKELTNWQDSATVRLSSWLVAQKGMTEKHTDIPL